MRQLPVTDGHTRCPAPRVNPWALLDNIPVILHPARVRSPQTVAHTSEILRVRSPQTVAHTSEILRVRSPQTVAHRSEILRVRSPQTVAHRSEILRVRSPQTVARKTTNLGGELHRICIRGIQSQKQWLRRFPKMHLSWEAAGIQKGAIKVRVAFGESSSGADPLQCTVVMDLESHGLWQSMRKRTRCTKHPMHQCAMPSGTCQHSPT
jgi:hypothetical protein